MNTTAASIETGPLAGRAPRHQRLAVAAAIAVLSASAAAVLVVLPDHAHSAGGGNWAATVAVAFALWVLMSVAMMLPTAWRFVSTYLDIAHAARDKAVTVPSISVLVAGYLVVWVGYSAVAAIVQVSLQSAGLGLSGHGTVNPGFAGMLLICAGLYELTPLKSACLSKCRNPFTVLFARFRPDRGRIFRLGAEQGLFCLGCCWALMALMLATGILHLGFMAILAAVMAAQKHWAMPRFDTPFGLMLIAGGLALVAWSGA